MNNNFPQQVSHDELPKTLYQFFQGRNERIDEVFSKYERDVTTGAKGEDRSEITYNNQQYQRVVKELKEGNEEVMVEWYEPHVEHSTPPKVSMQKKRFKLEQRYGNWIKHSHDMI